MLAFFKMIGGLAIARNAHDITLALGGRWQGHYGMARCPCHVDKTASLKITDKPDTKNGGSRVDFHCFKGCNWIDVKAELVRQGIIEPWRPTALQQRHAVATKAHQAKREADAKRLAAALAAAQEDEAKRIANALKLWDQCEPIGGTLGGTYLRVHRGFEFPEDKFDHALRYHKAKQMLVELMTDPQSGSACGIQRVFLNDIGEKITRKMLGKAGVCKLSPDEDVVRLLHLCEGAEDGIKIICAGYEPTWACLSAGMMKSFPVLSGIECLTMIPDLDPAGKQAVEACAARWEKAGREVIINDTYLR